jgi:hypothetical protein
MNDFPSLDLSSGKQARTKTGGLTIQEATDVTPRSKEMLNRGSFPRPTPHARGFHMNNRASSIKAKKAVPASIATEVKNSSFYQVALSAHYGG